MKVTTGFAVLLVIALSVSMPPVSSEAQDTWFSTASGNVRFVEIPASQAEGCGGTAPWDHWCTMGTMDPVRAMGCGGGPDYTGTVESVLVWDNGFRWFACSFEDGRLVEAQGGGTFPGLGERVRLECWSYESGTAGSLPRPNGLGSVLTAGPLQGNAQAESDPQGVPGGHGEWGCFSGA